MRRCSRLCAAAAGTPRHGQPWQTYQACQTRQSRCVESASCCRSRFAGARAANLHLQPAALASAGRPALVHLGIGRERKMVEHARNRGRVEPAERHRGRFARLAEERAAQIDRRRAAPQPDLDARSGIGGAHERPRRAECAARPQHRRQAREITRRSSVDMLLTVQSAAYSPARAMVSIVGLAFAAEES